LPLKEGQRMRPSFCRPIGVTLNLLVGVGLVSSSLGFRSVFGVLLLCAWTLYVARRPRE
jgi:hypothetical protein